MDDCNYIKNFFSYPYQDEEEEDDEDDDEEEEEEEDDEEEEEEEGSEDEANGEEDDYTKLPQVGTILYRDGPQPPQQPPLPLSPQAQSQPPPPPLPAAFVPVQPLPDYNPADYPGSNSPDLQRVLVGQQMLGQQQQGQGQQLPGLGPGMIPQQAPDGLMVATPAQTLTDTLDDIMAGQCMMQGCGFLSQNKGCIHNCMHSITFSMLLFQRLAAVCPC